MLQVMFVCGVAVVGVLVGERLRGARALVVGALCALPWCAFAAYYVHVVDVAPYYEWRSWPVTDLLAGLIGVSLGAVVGATVGPRVPMVVGAAVVAVGLVIAVFAKPVLRLLPPETVRDRWVGDVCVQSTPSTCGPCATATVLRSLGLDVKESELAREAQSTTSGTLNWLLARALRARGLETRFRHVERLEDVRVPAVIGVRFWTMGHFLALLGREGDRFVIGEPLSGKRVLTLAEFEHDYVFDEFAMEVIPP
jgi:hypothetical protein